MHYTGTLYRNPYEPPSPMLEITQGCTHNRCKFCTMYKEVPFRMSPMEWIEEDLKELAESDPNARTIQLLSANPLVLSYDKLERIFKLIHQYLPKMEYIYLAGRVTDLRNKSVEELRTLKELGVHSVWLRGFDARTVSEVFDLPENIIPVMMFAMGYPSEKAKPSAWRFKRMPLENFVTEL